MCNSVYDTFLGGWLGLTLIIRHISAKLGLAYWAELGKIGKLMPQWAPKELLDKCIPPRDQTDSGYKKTNMNRNYFGPYSFLLTGTESEYLILVFLLKEIEFNETYIKLFN